MFNTIKTYAIGVSKPLSIYLKLAEEMSLKFKK